MKRRDGHAIHSLGFIVLFAAADVAGAQEAVAPYRVQGDEIRVPLAMTRHGDPASGRDIVRSREGNCLLCHLVPDAGAQPMGNVGPSLAGVGTRLSREQLRLRLVDSTRINHNSVMPPYHRISGLNRVAPQYRGRPLLSAQQIEDVVAYLATLK